MISSVPRSPERDSDRSVFSERHPAGVALLTRGARHSQETFTPARTFRLHLAVINEAAFILALGVPGVFMCAVTLLGIASELHQVCPRITSCCLHAAARSTEQVYWRQRCCVKAEQQSDVESCIRSTDWRTAIDGAASSSRRRFGF